MDILRENLGLIERFYSSRKYLECLEFLYGDQFVPIIQSILFCILRLRIQQISDTISPSPDQNLN